MLAGVLIGPDNRCISLWDLESRTSTTLAEGDGPVSVAFTPDGLAIAWGGWANWDVNIRNLATGQSLISCDGLPPPGRPAAPQGIHFARSGDLLLLAGHTGNAVLVRTTDMRRIGRPIYLDGRSDCARLSPDDRLVVTTSEDGIAQLWDAATQDPVGSPMSHAGWVRSASFSPDGRYLATASEDMTVQLWHVATQQPVGLPLRHTSELRCVEFSPDGRYIATAAARDARVWELPPTPNTLQEVQRKTQLATGARLTPEGRAEALDWREWQEL
jgi:WD40 repeat protein